LEVLTALEYDRQRDGPGRRGSRAACVVLQGFPAREMRLAAVHAGACHVARPLFHYRRHHGDVARQALPLPCSICVTCPAQSQCIKSCTAAVWHSVFRAERGRLFDCKTLLDRRQTKECNNRRQLRSEQGSEASPREQRGQVGRLLPSLTMHRRKCGRALNRASHVALSSRCPCPPSSDYHEFVVRCLACSRLHSNEIAFTNCTTRTETQHSHARHANMQRRYAVLVGTRIGARFRNKDLCHVATRYRLPTPVACID
jgi:hypothetical protein